MIALSQNQGILSQIMTFMRRYIRLRHLLLFILPLLLAVFYFLFLASDRYLSSSKLAIHTINDLTAGGVQTAFLGNLVGGSTVQDLGQIKEYIASADMLEILDKRHQLRSHMQEASIDWYYRLPTDAPLETFLEYYRSFVTLTIDDVHGILSVDVQGFKPDYTYKIASTIIQQAELFMNESSHKVAREQVRYVEQELEAARLKLDVQREKVLKFLNENKVTNPEEQGKAQSMLLSELEAELAQSSTQLRSLLSYMKSTAPEVVLLRSKVAALKTQIAQEKSRLAGEGNTINEVLAEYKPLEMDLEFSLEIYKNGLQTLEKARIEASRKVKNVMVVQSPTYPEAPTYPKRLLNIFLSFLCIGMIYAIVMFVVASIRDHIE